MSGGDILSGKDGITGVDAGVSEFDDVDKLMSEAGVSLRTLDVKTNVAGAEDSGKSFPEEGAQSGEVKGENIEKKEIKKEVSQKVKTSRKVYDLRDLDPVTIEIVRSFKATNNVYNLIRAILAVQDSVKGINKKNLSMILEVDLQWLIDRINLLDVWHKVLEKLENANVDLDPSQIKLLLNAKDRDAQMLIAEEFIAKQWFATEKPAVDEEKTSVLPEPLKDEKDEKKEQKEGAEDMRKAKPSIVYKDLSDPLKKFIDEFKPEEVSIYRLIEVCMSIAKDYGASNKNICELLDVEVHWLAHRMPLAKVREKNPEAFNALKEAKMEMSQPFLLALARQVPAKMLKMAEDYIASGGKKSRGGRASAGKVPGKKGTNPVVRSKDDVTHAASLSDITAIAEEMNDSASRLGGEAKKIGLQLIALSKLDKDTIKFAFALSGLDAAEVSKAAEIIEQALFLA